MREKIYTTMIKGKSCDLWISDEPEFIKECAERHVPVIEYTHSDSDGTDEGSLDASPDISAGFLTPWASDSVDAVKNDTEYMEKVIHRFADIPLTVAETEELIIRELCEDDAESVEQIFAEGGASGYTDIWSDCEEDKKKILREYCRLHYDLYGYGYYGIVVKGEKTLAGIAGFRECADRTAGIMKAGCEEGTEYREIVIMGPDPDENPLELGYVMSEKYRRKGYCVSACRELIKKIPGNVYIVVDKNNIPGLKTAEKISGQTGIFDSDSSA